MCRRRVWVLLLLFGIYTNSFVDSNGWRLTAEPPAMSETEKGLIGLTVCSEGKFKTTGNGVRCRTCPSFTCDAGSDEGLDIEHMIHGRFTAAGAEGEWLLDTDGCEAHYESFGVPRCWAAQPQSRCRDYPLCLWAPVWPQSRLGDRRPWFFTNPVFV